MFQNEQDYSRHDQKFTETGTCQLNNFDSDKMVPKRFSIERKYKKLSVNDLAFWTNTRIFRKY